MFLFSQSIGTWLNCNAFSNMRAATWQLPVPSGPWDASCVPSSCVCSGFWTSLKMGGTLFSSPCLEVQGLERHRREDNLEKWDKKFVEYLSLLHVGCHLFSCQDSSIFLNFPFLANVPVKVLILYIPCQTRFRLCLSFPHSILYIWVSSLYSSQDTHFCFLPVHFLALHYFDQVILTEPCCLLSSLSDFLHVGIENFCTLRKTSLKSCQLCSALLFLRAVSQGFQSFL